jgi:hypothetical protein
MIRLPRPLLFAAFLLTSVQVFAAEPNSLTREEIEEGWILLFDGQTEFGWKAEGDANWTIGDGVIRVADGGKGLLRTTTQFADFSLSVQFRSEPGANSGVLLRTSPKPTNTKADCYEVNIADFDHIYSTGGIVSRAKTDVQLDSPDWQTMEVTAEGDTIKVRIDGQKTAKYTDANPLGRGFLALQHNHGKVEFRDIKLKPLGLASIFNGEDLSQWIEYPDMASKFSVTDEGYLNVKDGRGQLETKGKYGDFVLQLECFVNGEGLNSGIFFRCIPGDQMMGYESQIQNAVEGGDRTKPVDCGTGGIFRRVDARKVNADDFKWFTKTLIAEGPHIAVWVDGLQVTDWTDTRKPDENPRRGLRTAPGTLQIQGHDPTTDLSFRNLRAGEMAKRR